MNDYLKYIFVFAVAAGLSFVFSEIIKNLAKKSNFLVKPREDRWHKKPTPIFGGIGIFTSFIITYLIFIRADGEIIGFLIVSTFIFFVGLLDDLRDIAPPTKFLLQILGAIILIYFDFILEATGYYVVNFMLTLFWLVGITNAFNLLDNMDGLSAGIALITSIFLALFFGIMGEQASMLTSLAFSGAMLGFLIHNFNPASIFMGDAGSLFTGFFIAGVALIKKFPHTSNIFYIILIPTFLLLVPIFDTTFVTLTRKLAGRPISTGGKDHTSHRLVSIGLTERKAVLLLYGFSIMSGLLAFAIYYYSLHISIVFIPLTFLIFIFVGIYLARIRPSSEENEIKKEGPIIPILVSITFKRRIFEIAMDFVLITVSYYAALLLRFEADVPSFIMKSFFETLPMVVILKLSCLYAFGAYRGVWKYFDVADFIKMFQALFLSSALIIVGIVLIFRFEGFSRAVFIIDFLLISLMLIGARLSFRVLDSLLRKGNLNGELILIYGAGDGGELLLREILNNAALNLTPVGFLDDDDSKWGKKIHGYPVFGDYKNLDNIVKKHNIKQVIISTFKMKGSQMEKIAKSCNENNIKLRKLAIRIDD